MSEDLKGSSSLSCSRMEDGRKVVVPGRPQAASMKTAACKATVFLRIEGNVGASREVAAAVTTEIVAAAEIIAAVAEIAGVLTIVVIRRPIVFGIEQAAA